MSTVARPQPVATDHRAGRSVRTGQRRVAAAGLAVGVVLAVVGGLRLGAELHRQRVLEPLTDTGGWQRAVVADGIRAVADRAEDAARRIDDGAGWRDGAAILGSLATATGDPDMVADLRARSLTMALRSLEHSPGSARAHLLAGAALADSGDDGAGRAAAHLARAAALDPNNAGLRQQLGYVALSRSRPDEAAAHFQAALAVDAADARQIYETLNLFANPLSPVDVTPRTIAAQSALGAWLEDEGDVETAREAFSTSLVLADTGEGETAAGATRWAYARLQAHFFRQRDWDAAERLAGTRLTDGRYQDDSERALLHHHRGVAELRAGRPAEALEDLARATEIDPESLPYRDAHARALAALGRHDEAAAAWEQALTLPRPTARDARWEPAMRLARARSLLSVPQPGPAVDELRAVLRKDPMNAEARRLLRELGL